MYHWNQLIELLDYYSDGITHLAFAMNVQIKIQMLLLTKKGLDR
jgi:hypothetical protein